MFEDDPIEYIRRDLEPSSGWFFTTDLHVSADRSLESDTRRLAATEFTRALMEQFEKEVTNIIKAHITAFLVVSL